MFDRYLNVNYISTYKEFQTPMKFTKFRSAIFYFEIFFKLIFSTTGHYLHYFLGCCVCVLSYIVCAFQGSVLAELIQQTVKVDRRLYRLSGVANNFQNISNRFQFFVLIFGILMCVATIVLDFLIFIKYYYTLWH